MLEGVLKRDTLPILAGLIAITLLAWAYLVAQTLEPDDWAGSMARIAELRAWTTLDALLMFVMWAVMMVGMMLPSAAPVVLLHARVWRSRAKPSAGRPPGGALVTGYLAAWTGFSLLATLAQWWLETAALLSPMMESTSPLLGGIVLVLAGIYQWTPLKRACLSHCRSPIDFLSSHWRDGRRGAFMLGLRYGIYCLGCCWLLMLLLFVIGVMNLALVAALTLFVLLEKTLPRGEWLSRGAGIALVLWGAWLTTQA